MCGVVGVGGGQGPRLVQAWAGKLHHRGPDDEGIWQSPELTLGHRRLTILGLDRAGRQPMTSRSGDSIIVFNGEIYNYRELADRLRDCGRDPDVRFDTSVLLEALEAWGVDILADLNGMFSFAWYRPKEQVLLLARDRWGKKPLFWGRYTGSEGRTHIAFSSELRSFSSLPGGPPPPDPLGVARYLVYDGMPGRRTVYKGVYKVPAGSWIEISPEGRTLRQGTYWSFRAAIRPVAPITLGELEESLLADLSQALALRLRSDVPVGLLLSGGIDSSLLAAVWRQIRPQDRIRTFTVGFEERSYDERRSARFMAEAVNSDHREVVLTGSELESALEHVWQSLSEPFADPSVVPTSALCKFARNHVKVALGGDGGDELQAGYDPFRAWRAARVMSAVLPRNLWYRWFKLCERMVPPNPANMSTKFKMHHFAQGFLHPANERIQGWMASFTTAMALSTMKPELAEQVEVDAILEPTRRAFDDSSHLGDLHAQMHVWIATYLESSILTKVDRASMMHSLEVRAPFLDPNFAQRLIDLPPELIFRGGKGKYLLRRLARRLLPAELLTKPKKGLGVPLTLWLTTVMRDRMEEALEQSRTGGWYCADAMQALWREHLAGRYDHRKSLWNFLFAFPFQS